MRLQRSYVNAAYARTAYVLDSNYMDYVQYTQQLGLHLVNEPLGSQKSTSMCRDAGAGACRTLHLTLLGLFIISFKHTTSFSQVLILKKYGFRIVFRTHSLNLIV